MESAQSFFVDVLEVGIFGDNSNVPLEKRLKVKIIKEFNKV